MKKLFFVVFLCLTLCACHIRHDHSAHMMQVRVAMDHHTMSPSSGITMLDDSLTYGAEDWEEDPLIETQGMMMDEEVDMDTSDDEALEELERIMQGAAE